MPNRYLALLTAASCLAIATAVPVTAATSQPVFVPQPPPLSPPPPPSPPSTAYSSRQTAAQDDRLQTIAVRVTAGGVELLNDQLRVRIRQGATLSRTRNEASLRACQTLRYAANQTSINLQINSVNEGSERAYRISFRWNRPAQNGEECQQSGTQEVGVEQTVTIVPGKPTLIRSDANILIELRII